MLRFHVDEVLQELNSCLCQSAHGKTAFSYISVSEVYATLRWRLTLLSLFLIPGNLPYFLTSLSMYFGVSGIHKGGFPHYSAHNILWGCVLTSDSVLSLWSSPYCYSWRLHSGPFGLGCAWCSFKPQSTWMKQWRSADRGHGCGAGGRTVQRLSWSPAGMEAGAM